MKTKTLLIASIAIFFSQAATAQNLGKEASTYPNDETPFYMEEGVKLSKQHNTPLILTGLNDAVTGNTPGEMAKKWVKQNKELLKVSDVNDLVVYAEKQSLAGSNVRLRQHKNGVAVYQSEIVVHISKQNKVTYVTNNYDPSVTDVSTIAGILDFEAIELAKANLGVDGEVNFQDSKMLVYNKGAKTTLVHQVTLEPENPLGSWEILVDAQTGAIIKQVNRACNHGSHKKGACALPPPVNGNGNVWLPDPLSVDLASYAGPYVDNNDANNATFDATLSNVTLLDINFTGTMYELNGPYAEIQDFENPSKGLFDQPTSVFNFNRNEDGFEAVNCYYHIDNNMRYINTTLGIPCMPFQYATGVRFDPSGLNGADNSHYLGGSGRISFGEGGVDDAEDADVVLHELGHGIHDWLTNGNLSQVNGLSEGSGDYWASSYSRSLNQWTLADPEYFWMFSWDGHNPFWNGRVTNYPNLYPGGLVGQIHTDGQIWATTLLRIYDIIGRTKVDAAFLEGLAMTGNSTSQEDAAIAVRQAAIDMGYSCADVNVFTTEFEATGYNMPALPPVTGSETSTICIGESITVNGTVYDANNPTGTEVISNGPAVCDSTVTINLTVLPAPATGLVDNEICSGDVMTINGTVYDENNLTGTEVIVAGSVNGCDSTVNISLTLVAQVTNNINSTLCEGESITVNGTVYDGANPTGTETFVAGSINGCDSIVNINLTVLGPVTGTEASTICSGESITVNGTVYDENNLSGTEVISAGSVNGCDSTVTVSLTALPAATGTESSTICFTESIDVNGTTYDASNPSGTEVIAGGAANGCDSTVTISLTVEAQIDNTVTSTEPTLMANQTGATYQWIDCDDSNLPILGETGQSYTATSNGNYAVEVTVGNCTETSACSAVANIGLNELDNASISIYPNPSNGLFTVEINNNGESINYEISTVEGKMIREANNVSAASFAIDLSTESKGIYLLKVSQATGSNVFKLILD